MARATKPKPRKIRTDLDIDVHVKPETISDKVAFTFVKM